MFSLPQKAADIRSEVENFFNESILPNNQLWHEQNQQGQAIPDIEKTIRQKAKSLGLWNMALPHLSENEPGMQLTNLEFTGVAEVLGRLEWASRIFNCHAPDVPNMELLQLFGSDAQKEQWLQPLLEAQFGSSFAMTEPQVASSDPVNLETRMVRDGDQWVIDGTKWFASNASNENCRLIIVVGVTDPEAAKSRRQSMILVPTDTPGIKVKRNLPVFNHSSASGLHPELEFTEVRVPLTNLLGEQGAGFAMGQARLGPARLHHCMRAIGECEVLISLMVKRSKERATFGKRIDEYSSTQAAISLSRIELDQCRLLV
ncbi:MAG: acyl-CoA dehydrogenase, partial [Gammaproteobacteria bacterium]|nr:acyl-CoA dehydrogenase [Gammaproteobacteria bacterium]